MGQKTKNFYEKIKFYYIHSMHIFYNANGTSYHQDFFLFHLQQKPDVIINNKIQHVSEK